MNSSAWNFNVTCAVRPGLPPIQESVLNRNGLYLIIGALLAVIIGFGIYTYQQENKPGVELKIGEGGVSIEGK